MATREVRPAPASRPTTSINDLRGMLEKYKEQIATALPKHITPERMIRLALTAFNRTPLLARCSAISISGALVQASILGLEPDGLSGEAFLIPYWNTKAGGYECQMQAGYKGLVKLARNTGEYKLIDAQPVHDHDKFLFQKGAETTWTHKWDPREERGPIYGYWGGYALKNGGGNFEYMSVTEIERHRDQYSMSAYKKDKGKFILDADGNKILTGPWKDSPDWMFRKVPLTQVLKLAPKSNQLAVAMMLNEHLDAGLPQTFVDVPRELNPALMDEDGDLPKALADGNDNGGVALISEVQIRRLEQIGEENGWRQPEMLTYLKKQYGISALHELPAKEFDSLIEVMRTGGDPDK